LALSSRQNHKLTVFAFDLLHRDGADLRHLPLTERRRRLERLLARSDVTCLRLVAAFDDGGKLFAEAERRGLEGIVSKRKASSYRSGPSRGWLKSKTVHCVKRTGSGGGCFNANRLIFVSQGLRDNLTVPKALKSRA
jgi:ATP-dependent DNA ligase